MIFKESKYLLNILTFFKYSMRLIFSKEHKTLKFVISIGSTLRDGRQNVHEEQVNDCPCDTSLSR